MTVALNARDLRAEPIASHAGAHETTADAGLLRFITCGSVDDGKSTLIGRLLYDSESVFEDHLEALDKDSRRFGTQGEALDLALLVDGLSAEREQGITIDVAHRYFATQRRAFIVADTPGHEQYTRNMATGASTAELAIILIDARKGILPQTRRHSFIVSMLGVRHVAVAVNKMDLVGFDQTLFERIVREYCAAVAELGFQSIALFPISARDGDNVATRSEKMPWYQGPPLLEYLETVDVASVTDAHGSLLPVQWVNRPNLDFRGYSGTIARGTIAPGDEIVALPRGTRSRITRIVTADGDLSRGVEGQAVTLTLADEIDISRGDVMAASADAPVPSRDLAVQLLWTGDRPLVSGVVYGVKLATSTAEARIVLREAIDIHSFNRQPTTTLEMNGIASAILTLDRALVALPYRENRDLGGFILIDRFGNETVAFGLVEEITGTPVGATNTSDQAARSNFMQTIGAFLFDDSRPSGSNNISLVAAATFFSALLVWILSSHLWIAIVFAAGDLVLRPLVRRAWLHVSCRRTACETQDLNADGAGI